MSRSQGKIALLIMSVVIAASMVVGCGAQQDANQSTPVPAPEATAPSQGDSAPQGDAPADADAGSALVDEHCTRCHDRGRVDAATYDREAWAETVQRMKANGLEISPEDEKAIVDYLAGRDN